MLGTRDDWRALGVEPTDETDDYGIIARYCGQPTARLWRLRRRSGGWAGTICGAFPVQGYGVIGTQPWYFRARHGHWSLSIAETLDRDPVTTTHFWWMESI